ncbi:NAD(P)-dependent oxidoreductase [Geobacter sp. AOG1]|uniref:NAD-dependent epimerase/dehydratase family protein n=1 Tax=Geobacter sp. AOG1 TaxID=1566346 RepID=UPI001CC72C9F|nr:NAD(P)-dependent oxidoreductase [Geobacter sp. AOG1]GFE58138.1 epimerase [Geobacter sp. AOG1]
MNILLTGGSGFIGRNIREQLSGRYTVISPGHRELDLTDEVHVREFFLRNDIDVVIHGAVKPGHRNAADQSGLLDANTRMFFNLMANADRFRKMIFLGSGAVYDMRHYKAKMEEGYFGTHIPVDPHGFSKYIIAKYLEHRQNVVKLRLFGVFGKYEDYAIRFISNAICKALFDLPITIKQNRHFDYLYIDDLMPVLEHFIENRAEHVAYNVTPDAAVDLYSLAEMVRCRSGKDLPIVVGEPGLGPEYSGDNRRLRAEIPGLTFTPLVEAIDRLYGWYENRKDSLNRELLLTDK